MIKGLILSLLVISLSVSATKALGQAIDVSAAKKEGKVIVYGSVVPQAMEELHKGFEKKYDIKDEDWRGTLHARWRSGRKQSGAPADPASTWWSPAGTL